MLVNVYDGKLTDNFNIDEFCQHEDVNIPVMRISPDFLKFVSAVQEFRTWYNRPMNISSAYRNQALNKACGGSYNSSHLIGLAIDFYLPREYMSFDINRKQEFLDNCKKKWIEICKKYKYPCQCNYYDMYIHIGFGRPDAKDSFIDKRSS